MKRVTFFITLVLLLVSCSSAEPDYTPINPVATFKNVSGAYLFDNVTYYRDSLHFSFPFVSDEQGPVENFGDCDSLFVFPTVSDLTTLLFFGNGDVDTISYKWEGGNETVAEIQNMNWLEVYYNSKVVKRWDFKNPEQGITLIRGFCDLPSCPTDCSSPDVIEIVKK